MLIEIQIVNIHRFVINLINIDIYGVLNFVWFCKCDFILKF